MIDLFFQDFANLSDSWSVHSRFDLRHAQWMADAAALVYSSPEIVLNELDQNWGLGCAEWFEVQDTQAFVAADERLIIVSFRGTEQTSLRDWITDASTDLVAGPLGGRVHAGFYDALANIWWSLERYVAWLQRQRNRPLLVTGHSLGAALATLAVARWIEAGQAVHALYTFGQPRTGDSVFARAFNFAYKPCAFRFVNNNDLVTRIPPRSFGYSHLGCFKYFTESGDFSEEIGWWERFLDGWRGRIEDVFSAVDDGIRDHGMLEYQRLVKRARGASPIRYPRPHATLDRFLGAFLPPARAA